MIVRNNIAIVKLFVLGYQNQNLCSAMVIGVTKNIDPGEEFLTMRIDPSTLKNETKSNDFSMALRIFF